MCRKSLVSGSWNLSLAGEQHISRDTEAKAAGLRRYLGSTVGDQPLQPGEGNIETADVEAGVSFLATQIFGDKADLSNLHSRVPKLDYRDYVQCLSAANREQKLFAKELRQLLARDGDMASLELAGCLSNRRSIGQLQDEC
ncbi:hypothetical protein MKZ38_010514 [Zalerion maritima]|uniref:Uncharacterized protein n=1 Tax=Zalerion maritima TaxID=339359 RepID=A0AAD5RJJ4_9PEZI|nr:hypothetical protein MKZ38_010514 [Zalerion maritima]